MNCIDINHLHKLLILFLSLFQILSALMYGQGSSPPQWPPGHSAPPPGGDGLPPGGGGWTSGTPPGAGGAPRTKDPHWLALEVCREYARGKCNRRDEECKFAHPPAHVDVQNGRVTCCFDSLHVLI